MQSDDLGLASVLRSRIGVEFDGEAHLTEAEAQSVAAAIERLVEAREALRPFAEFAAFIAEKRPGWDHDDFPIITMDALAGCMHMFAFRRARQALGDT